jgi:hypothetical protein
VDDAVNEPDNLADNVEDTNDNNRTVHVTRSGRQVKMNQHLKFNSAKP